ncbi:hypothetical protein DFR30_2730 [Thiogranum longum]|uniref:Uncharacterized protein n=1 Tax=Thiogranum longum TaxID=1537524 RepID=A0A4R1HIW7_9GAMM|nr:hypothetical protein DFR30_2730 [Thiogranum longum]
MNRVPDFTDNELWIIRSTLQERYGGTPELRPAETERHPGRSRTGLTASQPNFTKLLQEY